MYSVEIAQEMLIPLKKVEDYYSSGDWIGVLKSLPKGNIIRNPDITDIDYLNFLFKLRFGGDHIDDVLKKCYEKLEQELDLKFFIQDSGKREICLRFNCKNCISVKNSEEFLKMKLKDILQANVFQGTYIEKIDSFISSCYEMLRYSPRPIFMRQREITLYTYDCVSEYLKKPGLFKKARMIKAIETYSAQLNNEKKAKFSPCAIFATYKSLILSKKKMQVFVEDCNKKIEEHQYKEKQREESCKIIADWLKENEQAMRKELNYIIEFLENQLGYSKSESNSEA